MVSWKISGGGGDVEIVIGEHDALDPAASGPSDGGELRPLPEGPVYQDPVLVES